MTQLQNDSLLNVSQAAEFIGVKPGTLREYVRRGTVPYIRLSGMYLRFRRESLSAWAAELETPAQSSAVTRG